MSHKTIYIDVDEEITSIVDRLRKAQANEIIVVVPKRALLLQSLVNLKLLKKESSRKNKQLMIVTQDRIGKKLIEKAGILVQGKLEGNFEEEEFSRNNPLSVPQVASEDVFRDSSEDEIIGSDDYFDDPLSAKAPQEDDHQERNIGNVVFEKKGDITKKKEKKRNVDGGAEKSKALKEKKGNRQSMSDIVQAPRQKKIKKTEKITETPIGYNRKARKENLFPFRESERQKNINPNDFFHASSFSSPAVSRKKEEKVLKVARVKGRSGKYFIFFMVAFLFFASLATGFFLLPQATVFLHMKSEEKSISLNITANSDITEIDVEKGIIPAQKFEMIHNSSEEYEATGSKNGAGRATGKVVIYNEFSTEDQQLVATTRLETIDGKIFRITKNIVVPGMAKVGGEPKPGAVETEVVADKPGSEYNIEPTTFKITGFKGGPKFEKFYAKSDESMKEGAQGEMAIVTSQDLALAKEKTITKAEKDAMIKLEEQIGNDFYFFENTVKHEIQRTASSKNIGSSAEKFNYSVDMKIAVLAIQKTDIEKLIEQNEKLSESGISKITFSKDPSYVLSENDIGDGSLKFELKADIDIAGEIDLANFKKGMLGKSENELESLLKNYPSIKSADVNFWPFFVNRVPISEKKVKVEIQ